MSERKIFWLLVLWAAIIFIAWWAWDGRCYDKDLEHDAQIERAQQCTKSSVSR